ncbi:hypothetical protein ES703_16754 [subsurface metagenome]
MAKYKTLELHLHTMKTVKLGPNNYKHTITLVDWDDGEEVIIAASLHYPISAITPLKMRVVEEDIPEAPSPA